MKKIIFISLLVVVYVFKANALVSMNDLSRSVVFLSQVVDGREISGTGFIIAYHNKYYLVTAKHVADSLTTTAQISLNLKNGNGVSITFRRMLDQNALNGAHWFYHPEQSIDIAVHPFDTANKDMSFFAIPESIYSKKEIQIKLLNKVYVLGFPLGLGIRDKISPIAKEARIGSNLTTIDVVNISDRNLYYLLDEALAKGYSGAPVYYIEDIYFGDVCEKKPIPGDEIFYLLGIQSQVLRDTTGGKISLVVPIMYLFDIFNSGEFKKYEKRFKK